MDSLTPLDTPMVFDARDILIGIDGGGSGCRVAIRSDDGTDLGRADGGAANVMTDRAAAIGNVLETLWRACGAAGLVEHDLSHARVHAGLAGAVDDAIVSSVADALQRDGPFAACTVSDDREIQALGALGGRDGYLLAIGTGTIIARLRDGEVTGVDGWGFVLSDHGSGADLGRAALRYTLLAIDGIEPGSALTRSLLDMHGSPSAIVGFAARARPSDFAALAPHVLASAQAGDTVARGILSDAASYFDRALAVLGFVEGDRLCLAGGIGPTYREWLASAGSADLVDPVGGALDGALRRAGEAR